MKICSDSAQKSSGPKTAAWNTLNLIWLPFVILVAIAFEKSLSIFLLPKGAEGIGFETTVIDIGMLSILTVLAVLLLNRTHVSQNGVARIALPQSTIAMIAVVVVTGLLATGIVVKYAKAELEKRKQTRFDKLSEKFTNETQRCLDLYGFELIGGRGLYAANERVKRAQFKSYVDSFERLEKLPGSLGVGFITRVTRENLEEFISDEREDARF